MLRFKNQIKVFLIVFFTIQSLYNFAQPYKKYYETEEGVFEERFGENARHFSFRNFKSKNQDILTYLELSREEALQITKINIDIEGYEKTDSLPISAKDFPNLKNLSIYCESYNIYNLKGLSEFKNIENLDIRTYAVLDPGSPDGTAVVNLSEVWKLKSLKSLSIICPLYEINDSIIFLENLNRLYLNTENFPLEILLKMNSIENFSFNQYERFNLEDIIYSGIFLYQKFGYPVINIQEISKYNNNDKVDLYDILKSCSKYNFVYKNNIYTVFDGNKIIAQGKFENGKRNGTWFFQNKNTTTYDVFDSGRLIAKGILRNDTTVVKQGTNYYNINKELISFNGVDYYNLITKWKYNEVIDTVCKDSTEIKYLEIRRDTAIYIFLKQSPSFVCKYHRSLTAEQKFENGKMFENYNNSERKENIFFTSIVKLFSEVKENKKHYLKRYEDFYNSVFIKSVDKDDNENVIKTQNTYGFPLYTIKGDKEYENSQNGTLHRDDSKRDIMKKQEQELLRKAITSAFDKKRLSELIQTNEGLTIDFWVDSIGTVLSAEYTLFKKNGSIIDKNDIEKIDKIIRKVRIEIPPAYNTHKIFKQGYFINLGSMKK